jgi:hypothetical protein
MGLAKYYSKDLLAINQLLRKPIDLGVILKKIKIGIYFGENAENSLEGNAGLELLIRLLARLYPSLKIQAVGNATKGHEEKLRTLAHEINSELHFIQKNETVDIAVMASECPGTPKAKLILFVGSDKWIAKFSRSGGLAYTESSVPFGAAAASCIAAANIFRYVFKKFIPENDLDNEVELSTLSWTTNREFANPNLDNFQIKETALVGLGAIGSSTAWMLSKLINLYGELDVIDKETLQTSNLQRYIIAKESELDCPKANLVAEYLNSSRFRINPFAKTWAEYIKEKGQKLVSTIAVAVDTKNDRILVQAALPKSIINAYTDTDLVGVSRYKSFGMDESCLSCGFVPNQKELSYTEQVAIHCNISRARGAEVINTYMNMNVPVDSSVPLSTGEMVCLLDLISQQNTADRALFNQYHGKLVPQFYSEFICAGASLEIIGKDKTPENIDAPLAFQSAMAGIMLAIEIVLLDSQIVRKPLFQGTQYFPLQRFGKYNPQNIALAKNKTGRCLCADPVFIKRYEEKWSVE